MTDTALPAFWQRMDQAEQALCLRVNRGCRRPAVRAFFAAVSRAGDGVALVRVDGRSGAARPGRRLAHRAA